MARNFIRFLARADDVLELVLLSALRFAFSRRGVLVAGLCLVGYAAQAYVTTPAQDQGLTPGALVPAVSGTNPDESLYDLDLDEALPTKPVEITVDAIVGRHGEHAALVSYQGRSYRARPGTLVPQDGPPSFVITRVGCDSVEAYDWMARQNVTAGYTKPAYSDVAEVTE